jgi:hypothetical protein
MNFVSIKKGILISALFLLPTVIFSNNSEIYSVPAFMGGLNLPTIKYCEDHYQKLCPIRQTKNTIEATTLQWSCIKMKMAKDKSCAQAKQIRKMYGMPATNFRQYGPVSVFYTTTLADGIDQYYMVDSAGKVISLTTHLDLSTNKTYLILRKKYPDIGQTQFLYWTKINENLFPRSHTCVACAKVGILDVAYEFNPKGIYLKSALVKITPMSNKF